MADSKDYAYQQTVAAQAHKDAKAQLAESQQELKAVQRQIFETAVTSTLSNAEIEVWKNSKNKNIIPESKKAAVIAKANSLADSNPVAVALQKKVESKTTEVKSTQLTLNTATNNLQISQGRASGNISPITEPAIKQPPYNVNNPTTNTGSILNNPTGLIAGAVALQAVARSPSGLAGLAKIGGSIFGSNNITPVTSGVPDSAAPVSGATDSAANQANQQAAQQTATQTPAATAANPVNLAADPNTNLGAEAQAATDTPAVVNTEDPFEAQRLEAAARFDQEPAAFAPEDLPVLSDQEADALAAQQAENVKILAREATDVEPDGTGYSATTAIGGTPYDDEGNLNPGWTLDENNNPVYVGGGFVEPATQAQANADRTAAQVGKQLAQQQAARRAAENVPSQADWRVRLSLAKDSNYLYNFGDKDSAAGILAPLRATNGVIFPYTPSIETNYHAKYDQVDLVHSNYRGYFYKNSYIDTITVKGTFTAQDTREAQYLLAVIHFFRSVTKMFYGATDQYAGTPPPLVFLNGLGQFQFNNHPCLVTQFTYSLPNDVDYIRTEGFNNYNINLDNRRNGSTGAAPGGVLAGSFSLAAKLGINKLFAGGVPTVATPSTVRQQVDKNRAANSTYVPTKMEISIQLLPTQTRKQVSQQFNMKEFANGDLLKKGFW